MKALALFILLSAHVFAQSDCVSCLPELNMQTTDPMLTEISFRIEHTSYNNDQVLHAPCKHSSVNMEEINSFLSRTGNKKQKIRGIQFKDEDPELLRTFTALTTKNKPNWLQRLLGLGGRNEINFQERFQVNPACEKVLCAVDRIWGENVGRKLLYLSMKFGFNGSEFVHPNAQRFSESELDDVLMTMSDFPRAMNPIAPGRQLTKYLPDEEHPEESDELWANSTVILFSPWFHNDEPGKRQGVLFHELSHILQYQLPRQKQDLWNNLSSWVKPGERWEFDSIGACMISRYSMRDPYEDFAETATAYRYNARTLQRVCPDKYNFMKEHVFRGTEFLQESQCSGK